MADGKIIIDTKIDSTGAEKGVKGLGGKLGGIAKTGIMAFTGLITATGAALGGLGSIGVKYNAEMEQYMSSFTTMLGSAEKATNHLNDLKEFAAKTPFELGDLAKASTTLQAFGTNVEDITPTLKMLGDISLGNKEKFNGLALVFGQVQSQGKLMGQDLMQMINNGFNPLQIISEKTGKSMSELKDEMSKGQISFEMVADAMKIATSEGGKFYNAMDGQSKTLVGQWSTLKDNVGALLGDMFTSVSDVLTNKILPALNGVVEKIQQAFSDGTLKASIDTIAEGFGNLAVKIGEVIADWLPKIIEGFAWLLDNSEFIAAGIVGIGTALLTLKVVNTVSKIGGIFKDLFMEIATGTPIMEAFNIVLGMNPFVLIAAAVVGLVAGFIYLWNTSEGFRNFFINMWESIKTFFIDTWNAIMSFFTETIPSWIESIKAWFGFLGEWFGTLWTNIKQFFVDGWNAIASFFTESIPAWWEGIKQAFAAGWNAIVSFFTETIPAWIEQIFIWFSELPYKIGYALGLLLGTVIQGWINIFNYFKDNIPVWIENISTWFSELPGKIWTWLIETFSKIAEWGTNTWNKFLETCTNVYNSVTEWFSKLPGAIWGWLVQAISKAVQWGQETYLKMVEAVANAINAVIDWFAKLPDRIWQWLIDTISKVAQFASNLGSKASEAGSNMVSNIISAVSNLPGEMAAIGSNIVHGVWNGITGMGSWLASKVSGFFSGIVNGAKKALGIHSPSRVFRDQVGKYMAQGVGVGFEDEADNVQKSMEKDFKTMAAKMQATVNYETSKTSSAMAAANKSVSNSTVTNNNNDNGVTLHIEKFENNTESDIETLAEEIAFVIKNKGVWE